MVYIELKNIQAGARYNKLNPWMESCHSYYFSLLTTSIRSELRAELNHYKRNEIERSKKKKRKEKKEERTEYNLRSSERVE